MVDGSHAMYKRQADPSYPSKGSSFLVSLSPLAAYAPYRILPSRFNSLMNSG
jgi:hypothetical protein